MSLNVLVFFGGCSSEYSVSLKSAASVLKHLDPVKYHSIPVGISRQGDWFYYHGDPERIENDTWCQPEFCIPAALSPSRSEHVLLLYQEGEAIKLSVDAAFPVLHGRNGEDGTLQGLLELAGIPLAGCGTLSSALCMDKDRAHRIAASAGVEVPRSGVLSSFSMEEANRLADEIGLPLFVKPVRAGSSFGISRIAEKTQLQEALREAFQYDHQVILEEAIPGFETGCAVLGNTDLILGEADEIELSGGFFDFTEKYTLKTSSIHVPARVSPETAARLKETAARIYRALDCRGFARVDMFLTPDGRIVFNEVNTIPGFTEHSRYPKMMEAAGYSFGEVLDKVMELALEGR